MSNFLPSLLEYTENALLEKLQLLCQKEELVLKITKQSVFSLHLDFVFPKFAKKRGVVKSLDLETVFTNLKNYWSGKKLQISVHLMALEKDLKIFEAFSYKLSLPKDWQVVWYIDWKLANKSLFFLEKLQSYNSKIGYWFDLLEWTNYKFLTDQNYLLMTVLAGKSGQTRQALTRKLALKIIENFSDSQFILDGGWSLQEELNFSNLQIVSYSSFWSTLAR